MKPVHPTGKSNWKFSTHSLAEVQHSSKCCACFFMIQHGKRYLCGMFHDVVTTREYLLKAEISTASLASRFIYTERPVISCFTRKCSRNVSKKPRGNVLQGKGTVAGHLQGTKCKNFCDSNEKIFAAFSKTMPGLYMNKSPLGTAGAVISVRAFGQSQE